MKKLLALCLAAVTLSLAVACSPEAEPEPAPPRRNIYAPPPRTAPYPENAADAAAQAAAHGYTLKAEQGYNRWYYREGSGGEMEYRDGRWQGGGAYLDGERMFGGEGEACRVFRAAADGRVRLTGALRTERGGEGAVAEIRAKGVRLARRELAPGDEIGWYCEVSANVSAGDELEFAVTGGSVVRWNPVVRYGESPGLFYDPPRGVGDLHPFYYDGRLYQFYLDTDGTYTSRLMVSRDMLTYTQTPLTLEKPQPEGEYFVLGVCRDGDWFRSYYGYSATVIHSSKSRDLLSWTDGTEFDTENMRNDYLAPIVYKPGSVYQAARDPYVFWDPDAGRYRIVYMGYYRKDASAYDVELALVTSEAGSMRRWEEQNKVRLPRFTNGGASGREEPEVPQMMKIGDRWYLTAYINNRSGAENRGISYWFGGKGQSIEEVDWARAEEYNLNGTDLIAAQLFEAEGRWYAYGWLRESGWGGAVSLPMAVAQAADGTLALSQDPELTDRLRGGRVCPPVAEISGSYSPPGAFGSLLATGGMICAGKSRIALEKQGKTLRLDFDFVAGRLEAYLDGALIAATPLNRGEESGDFKLIADGKFLDVYAGGACLTLNLAGRGFGSLSGYGLTFSALSGGGFSDVQLCALNLPED